MRKSRSRSANETSGSGSGSMNTCRWSKAATRRVVRESSMPLPNTSPLMSPMPATVKGSPWMSRPVSRKCRFTDSQAPFAVIPTSLWSYPFEPPEAKASSSQKPYSAATALAVSE